jgi:ComEC/Rec2-related protein
MEPKQIMFSPTLNTPLTDVSHLHYVRFMWLMTFILILIISVSDLDLFIGISDLTNTLHTQCLNITPETLYSNIYAALVCGEALDSSPLTQNLKNLGIYHVIIVSGSHLIFLSSMLEILFGRFSSKLRYAAFPILFIYSLATGFQPPVVRALVSILINAFQQQKKLFWNQNEVIFISLLTCFALVSPWKNSYSLLLSYVASVSLSLTSKNNSITKHFLIYCLLFVFLLPMAAPSPLSFLSNLLLAPVIGVILFPLSFLAYLIPRFYLLVDPLWKIFLYLCSAAGAELQSLDKFPISLFTLWILAISMNFYGIFKDKRIIK